MPKRTDRLKPIEHERRQLENLKTLEPIQTPTALLPLSHALVDLAIAALDEVYRLEDGEPLDRSRLQALYEQVQALPGVASE